MPGHPAAAKLSIWGILGKALVGALAGFFAAPVVAFIVVLVLNFFNPVCGTPGDSGGCEMGLATVVVGSALPGAAIGFIVNGLRGWRQR
ncbi:MAG: hypothetical protein GC182_06795 [Rhodopseudomonas sp.]|nr:hypothetical protein [Rhodopseudomonas sp.]